MSDPVPPYPGMPRWVKRSAIASGVLAILVAAIILFDIGGEHGPWRHAGVTAADTELEAAP